MNEEVTQTAGPIVVVCYTNHALDQFLEGILETYTKIPGAKGRAPIIRVGGRCKSEKLEEYILANVTKRERPRLPGDFYSNRDELRRQIDECRCVSQILLLILLYVQVLYRETVFFSFKVSPV